MTVKLPEDVKDANAYMRRTHSIYYGELESDRILAGLGRVDAMLTSSYNR